jgi:hypothetical protein
MGRFTVGRSSRSSRLRAALAAVALALSASRGARAYTVSTFVSDGCHEQLTDDAFRAVRAQQPGAAPVLAIVGADRAFVDDLPLELPVGSDLAAVTLLVGVRDNDLKGRGSTDLQALALIHGDPATQDEHCLRNLEDEEPNGTAPAIARCRAFILGRVSDALGFVGADGAPDPASRLALPVSLAIRGGTSVLLPGFYVRLGQALHALQDSFSHSYRTADSMAITTSLTWLHPIDDDLNEAIAGPPHSSELDRCVGLDDLRRARLAVAGEASRALLAAALGPGTRADRLAAAGAVLDTYLTISPGCDAANAWCDAPEHSYQTEPTAGCSVAGRARAAGVTADALLLLAALVARRRRGRAAAAATLVALVLAAGRARADLRLKPDVPDKRITAEAPEARFAERPRYGLVVSLGGSLNRTAAALAVGGRLRLTPRWLVGLDAEWNPWMSLEGEHVRVGAFNAFTTVVRRWSMLSDQFDVRTTMHLGTSTVLFDLYGVPAGTTGLYIGASLLGLEWRATRELSVIIDPADVAYPLPQLRGAPFGYLQYRFTLGLQWGA